MKMAEDFNHSLKQIGFSASVFADENIDKAVAIKRKSEIFEILVLAYIHKFQAHNQILRLLPSWR